MSQVLPSIEYSPYTAPVIDAIKSGIMTEAARRAAPGVIEMILDCDPYFAGYTYSYFYPKWREIHEPTGYVNVSTYMVKILEKFVENRGLIMIDLDRL